METIKIRRRANEGDKLTISLPESLRHQDLEVLVVLQPVASNQSSGEGADKWNERDERGWPLNFFEETYGSLAENLLNRLPQGQMEARESLE